MGQVAPGNARERHIPAWPTDVVRREWVYNKPARIMTVYKPVRRVALLLSLAPLLGPMAAAGPIRGAKTLDRTLDPVTIDGVHFSNLLGTEIGHLRLCSFRHGRRVLIPFQIDQRDSMASGFGTLLTRRAGRRVILPLAVQGHPQRSSSKLTRAGRMTRTRRASRFSITTTCWSSWLGMSVTAIPRRRRR